MAILNKVDFKAIDQACKMIRRYKKQPIMYISMENASKLVPFTIESHTPTVQVQLNYEEGMIGRFYGCIVYATEEVGDKIVIVPQYQEEIK